ncbi:hypothetical protein ACF1AE_33905 [Streptomyces sp. NPDC014986]
MISRLVRLARKHGGVARSWQRAVAEARALYGQQHSQDPAEETAPPVG